MEIKAGKREDDFDSLFQMATDYFRKQPNHHLEPFFAAGTTDIIASGVIRACLRCLVIGAKVPRDLLSMILRNGNSRKLDGLLQALAEVYVLSWLASIEWPHDVQFAYEPGTKKSKKPELRVQTHERSYLFEVKAPSFADFQLRRHKNHFQFVGRLGRKEDMDYIARGQQTTLPIDNKIKDFLKSAEQKFVGIKRPNDLAYLVVVWDDQLYEPVTALTSTFSGLLTPRTFDRMEDGTPVIHPSVDGVLLVSRLALLRNSILSGPMHGGKDVMDHEYQEPLPTGLARRAGARDVPQFLVDQLHIVETGQPDITISELQPIEVIYWPKGMSNPSGLPEDTEPVVGTVRVHGEDMECELELAPLKPSDALDLLAQAVDADCTPSIDWPADPSWTHYTEIDDRHRMYRKPFDPTAISPTMRIFLDSIFKLSRRTSPEADA